VRAGCEAAWDIMGMFKARRAIVDIHFRQLAPIASTSQAYPLREGWQAATTQRGACAASQHPDGAQLIAAHMLDCYGSARRL
jgi:hypothetical protein